MPLTVRLGLFYGAIFIGTGVSSPYLPVWFAHHGLSGSRIGLILSLPMLARAFTAPLLAVWADSFRLRRTALLILAALVTGAYARAAPRRPRTHGSAPPTQPAPLARRGPCALWCKGRQEAPP